MTRILAKRRKQSAKTRERQALHCRRPARNVRDLKFEIRNSKLVFLWDGEHTRLACACGHLALIVRDLRLDDGTMEITIVEKNPLTQQGESAFLHPLILAG
jgi:hypothetical protein